MNLEQLQNWVHNGPNGNSKEAAFLPALLQGAGLAAQAYGAYQASRPTPDAISPSEIAGYMSPVQGIAGRMGASIGRVGQLGESLMDPTSAINQQQQQMIREQSAEQLAMQALLNRRQAAAMGQESGITAAQNRIAQSRASQAANQQMANALMQSRAQGMNVLGQMPGLLGGLGRFQQGISENIAQAGIAQRQKQIADAERQRMMMGTLFGGVGGGLIDYAGTL